jgi:hypothetical protein
MQIGRLNHGYFSQNSTLASVWRPGPGKQRLGQARLQLPDTDWTSFGAAGSWADEAAATYSAETPMWDIDWGLLNPQLLPPRELTGRERWFASDFDWTVLNPQPLPPKDVSTADGSTSSYEDFFANNHLWW